MFGFGIIKGVVGGLLTPITSIFKTYFSYRRTKLIAEAGLITQVVKADMERSRLRKDLLAQELEWAPFRWMRLFVFASFLSYYILIVADSIFLFEYNVAALPLSVRSLIDTWAGWIISYFTIAGGQSVFGMVNRWIFNRK